MIEMHLISSLKNGDPSSEYQFDIMCDGKSYADMVNDVSEHMYCTIF